MNTILNAVEVRILGSLIEKQLTTPEYYPLTLNALTNACNQKNNRDPVVSFEETTVVRGIDDLKNKRLIGTVTGSGIRVPKYKHTVTETYNLTPDEVAVMCLLMLRGPQTAGEIRGRSSSMRKFENIADVESILQKLYATDGRESLVQQMPRSAGQKETRYIHLLSGRPEVNGPETHPPPEAATLQVRAENERISKLEDDVKRLKEEIKKLQQTFLDFKKQFE